MTEQLSVARPLVLGSASPRRREILERLGIPLVVLPADIDERVAPGEAPERYLERIAREKLAEVVTRLGGRRPPAVLVADTSVVLDGDVLGKPADVPEAVSMLRRLAGRAHRVLTRYALGRADGELVAAQTVVTEVWLRAADAEELEAYARTGEGLDKAGAYAVQGVGSFLVERLSGSYTNVVGLPACEVVLELKRHGLLGPFP